MKKYFIILVLLFVSINSFAQDIFESSILDEQFAGLISIKEKYYGNNKRWAQNLAKEYPTDDNGSISYEYIITFPDSLNIQTIIDKTIEWTNYKFKSNNAIQNICRDEGSEAVSIHGSLGTLAQQSVIDLFYAKKSELNAEIDIIIKYREGRLKIKSIIRHYTYISGDSMMTAKNILVIPNSIYPFNENKDINGLGDKNVCSLAFINGTANVIGFCVDYKDYMNKEFNKININIEEEDW